MDEGGQDEVRGWEITLEDLDSWQGSNDVSPDQKEEPFLASVRGANDLVGLTPAQSETSINTPQVNLMSSELVLPHRDSSNLTCCSDMGERVQQILDGSPMTGNLAVDAILRSGLAHYATIVAANDSLSCAPVSHADGILLPTDLAVLCISYFDPKMIATSLVVSQDFRMRCALWANTS